MFSDDTELLPLSTLLHNRAQEHPPTTDVPAPYTLTGSTLLWNSDEPMTGVTVYGTDPSLTVRRTSDGRTILITTIALGSGYSLGSEGTIVYLPATEDAYWSRFGIEHVELPENTPLVHAMWERICLRVNEAYYDRFLGGETLEQWQRRLQVITDRIIPRYERNLRIYKDNRTRLETELGMAQTTEYLDVKDTFEADTENRMSDTPDTAINEDQNYAGTVTKGTVQNSNTKTGAVRTTTTGRGGLVDQLNDNMDAWRDLESDLVDEYAKAFLSVIWY